MNFGDILGQFEQIDDAVNDINDKVNDIKDFSKKKDKDGSEKKDKDGGGKNDKESSEESSEEESSESEDEEIVKKKKKIFVLGSNLGIIFMACAFVFAYMQYQWIFMQSTSILATTECALNCFEANSYL